MFRRKEPNTPAVTQQGWLDRRVTRVVNSNVWLGAAVLMVVAVAAGALYLFIAPTPGVVTVTPPPAGPVPATAATATEAPPNDGCASAVPVDVPPESLVLTQINSDWKPVGTTYSPSSATGGPGIAAPYAACFTRTPEGALYAVAAFIAEASAAPKNAERLALVQARASRQGNYDGLIQSLSADGQTVGQPLARISGYRWIEYSPDSASVELQFRLIDSTDGTQPPPTTAFQVAWEFNDWRVVIPTEGGGVHLAGGKLRTFTPWGP